MYFDNCKNLNELKAEYRRLVMLHHPDCGGDTATMQAINAEHDKVFEVLKRKQNVAAQTDPKIHVTTETPEEFRLIVEALLRLNGIEVELCGSWLWIAGDTFPHAAALKALGCRWSASKKKWYWCHFEDMGKRRHRPYTMGQIRATYGSTMLGAEEERKSREVLTA